MLKRNLIKEFSCRTLLKVIEKDKRKCDKNDVQNDKNALKITSQIKVSIFFQNVLTKLFSENINNSIKKCVKLSKKLQNNFTECDKTFKFPPFNLKPSNK